MLKADLKVGEGNFPRYIVLCGDQQTYSILVVLSNNDMAQFAGFFSFSSNWHTMKLLSEQINKRP